MNKHLVDLRARTANIRPVSGVEAAALATTQSRAAAETLAHASAQAEAAERAELRERLLDATLRGDPPDAADRARYRALTEDRAR